MTAAVPAWRRWSARTPYVLAALAAVMSVVVVAVAAPEIEVWRALVLQLRPWGFICAGLVAWRTRPANPTGRLLLGAGVIASIGLGAWQARSAVLFTVGEPLAIAYYPVLVHLILAFPSGRLDSRAERRVVGAVYAVFAVVVPLEVLLPLTRSDCPVCPADLKLAQIDGLEPLATPAALLISVSFAATAFAVAWMLTRRWQRATVPGRRVLRPVVLSATAAAVALLVKNVADIATANAGVGPTAFMPGADRFEQSAVAVTSVAMVVTAAGFLAGLLRTRVTRSTLGDLVVGLGSPSAPERLRELIARALGDDTLELGFWVPERAGYVDAQGRVFSPAVPGTGRASTVVAGEGGQPLAVLVHDTALLHDEGLVDAVAGAARLALENAQLQAELLAQLDAVTESRARIVEAGDRERRRIERDLHDGAQQRLVGLAMALRMVQRRLDRDPQAAAMVESAIGETQGALSELRELATGLHPQILNAQGLGGALQALSERSAVPVRIAAAPSERLMQNVEACAYFVCSEAMQNAAKHAEATRVVVRCEVRGDALVVEIADDGIGGAQPGTGSGLLGLRDRVEALGGRLGVHSPPGGGTTLTAVVPVGAPSPEVRGAGDTGVLPAEHPGVEGQ